MDSESTTAFFELVPRWRKRIDSAFKDFSVSASSSSAAGPSSAGGGFIVDNDSDGESGIPMRLIPSALEKIGLPSDEQVMNVFEGAAQGWRDEDDDDVRTDDTKVGRDDWREVCTILVGQQEKEQMDEDGGDDDEDEYKGDDDTSEDEDDAASQHSDYDDGEEQPKRARRLTKNQKEAALQTFSLFFPSEPVDQLPTKRIRIAEIQLAAKVLGEKLKAAEITEMLEAFSSQKDLSVSLEDFGKLMQVAGLV